jgi:amino acid transporter
VTPFADAAVMIWGAGSQYWVSAGVAIAAFGALNGYILIQGQLPAAIANDKLFPAIFARQNSKGVPAMGVVISSVFVSVFMIMNYTKGLVAQFQFLILLTTSTIIIPYVFCTASFMILRLRKTFTPNLSGVNSYTLRFNNSLQRLGTKELISGVSRHPGFGSVTSSSFTFAEQESYFDDNGFGVLRTYYRSGSATLGRVHTNYNSGTIDYDTGIIEIQNFLPTAYSGDTISVIAAPLSPNINPVRNQILLLSQCVVNIINDNNNQTVATASNVETIGQISTLVTPSLKLYNF